MATNRNINNLDELRAEIVRLESLKKEQEVYLGDQMGLLQHKIEAPVRFFKRFTSWAPTSSNINRNFKSKSGSEDADWLTNSLRVGLPVIFNRVLFRKAGFIKKTLLLLASQKAASAINQDRVTGFISKLASIIRPSESKKRKKKKHKDYGIPPDSETY